MGPQQQPLPQQHQQRQPPQQPPLQQQKQQPLRSQGENCLVITGGIHLEDSPLRQLNDPQQQPQGEHPLFRDRQHRAASEGGPVPVRRVRRSRRRNHQIKQQRGFQVQ